jgi:gamma-glutamyltranspeptidase/glutathione hydrolase
MFTTRPEILGNFGIIASTHWLGSAADMAAETFGKNVLDELHSHGHDVEVAPA